jgi:putative flippase GtrA
MGSALPVAVTQGQKRFWKMAGSGVCATAVDVAVLILLVESGTSHVTLAAFLAAASGGAANFLLNKYWAFKDRSRIDLRQVVSYAFVSLVTALFVAAAVHVFAVLIGLPYLLAKAIAAALAFALWTYPAQSKIVFRRATVPPLDDAAASGAR